MRDQTARDSRRAGILVLDPTDNVGVALTALVAGEEGLAGDCTIRIREDIPVGHKIALVDIAVGGDVLKYGEVIGAATDRILRGDHAHVHNMIGIRAGQAAW
ncbi:MAG: hypothetical protein BMS9Abin12_0988 [Acidimicrobiia bacterium]|nr:MAG: hypothetical protein BMS9Abin12_0988 [Acidimicrobiia bacterium]